MATNETTRLAASLQVSRARITPEQGGIGNFRDRRPVAGLRCEELTMLAGVSDRLVPGSSDEV